jgi:hypothetical protein
MNFSAQLLVSFFFFAFLLFFFSETESHYVSQVGLKLEGLLLLLVPLQSVIKRLANSVCPAGRIHGMSVFY